MVEGMVDVSEVAARDVEVLAQHLGEFMKPHLEVIGWSSSREKQLSAFVAGLLCGTERKSVEPIAFAQGADRRHLQHFVMGVARQAAIRRRAFNASPMECTDDILLCNYRPICAL